MPMSEYELQRMHNIEENKGKLIALGIEKNPLDLERATPKTVKGASVNRRAKPERPPVRQRSLRVQNLGADGEPLPDRDVKPPTPDPEDKRPVRKPPAPLDAAKVSTGATSAKEAAAFLARLCDDRHTPGLLGGGGGDGPTAPKAKKPKVAPEARRSAVGEPLALAVAADDASRLAACEALGVADADIAKLVVDRIYAIEVHPSSTKLLVAAGDKWGKVGLWDVDAGEDAPVATFEPHSRPVGGLRVLPSMPHLLLSCAQDGAVRSLDLGGGRSAAFTEVYRAAEDSDGDYPSLHGLSRTASEGGGPAVCDSDGYVAMLDLRGAYSARFNLHEKKIYSVDFSPTRPWLLATASIDRTVKLWDCRKLSSTKAKSKPVVVLEHTLAVTAARFSPSGGRLLSTCNDCLLRVWGGGDDAGWATSSATLKSTCLAAKHNTKTGQYLTAFQAEWVRGSDDTFMCGSLAQPRGIDVYHAQHRAGHGNSGGVHAAGRLLDDNVGSVLSLLAWHPTAPVLAACNASGKIYLWR